MAARQASKSDKNELKIPAGKEIEELHNPKDEATLATFLNGKGKNLDLNAINEHKQCAPIHSIINSPRMDKVDVLYTLLVNGNFDIDLIDLDGMTPLHMAVQMNDIYCVRLLVAFGANLNLFNKRDGRTPLDLAHVVSDKLYIKQNPKTSSWIEVSMGEDRDTNEFMMIHSPDEARLDSSDFESLKSDEGGEIQQRPPRRQAVESEMMQFLKSIGGQRSSVLREDETFMKSRKKDLEGTFTTLTMEDAELYNKGAPMRVLYKSLEEKMKEEMDEFHSLRGIDEMVANSMQRKELSRFKKTGSRILCLDGGGLRGLIEIDLLHQLEMATGKKIVDLFDWIVGTSTGAVLALGLVYGKLSLSELRRLFFKLKEDVFSKPKLGFAYDTDTLETILKQQLGTNIKMGDVKHPKLVISAVHKETTPLQLHFFNNCFDDHLSNELVWKVARCTSGGPVLFAECNNYVDGGVLANNPTEQGITKILNYHMERGEKLPISVVISLGTGVNPTQKLGSVDAQDCIGFGPHLLKVKNRVGNLMELFTKALGESEIVAESCKRNFADQGVPYHRISPRLDEAISSGETDHKKLLNMILLTRDQTWREMSDIAKLLVANVGV